MEILRDQLNWKNLSLPLIFLIASLNPFTEEAEFHEQWLFMTTHYLLYIAGFLIGLKAIRGPIVFLLPGIALPVFWHVPLFFALAGAYLPWRAANDLTLFLAGISAGMTIYKLSNVMKILLFVLWMSADSVLSVVLIVGIPAYSDEAYPFSPFPVSQEPVTGLVMFGIMTAVFVYVVVNLVKSIFHI
ncbi:MAG: DUF1404 domain-containing protein [Candidatus Aramenus sp.]|nr:DUF1404 domain-containing protein [Candidatus Aramenus sp.]